jgi:hypothetical protein
MKNEPQSQWTVQHDMEFIDLNTTRVISGAPEGSAVPVPMVENNTLV